MSFEKWIFDEEICRMLRPKKQYLEGTSNSGFLN